MSNVSQGKKTTSKKRPTATAKDELLERARKAILRFGISSQKKLQDRIAANTEIAIGLNTISKFFNQKPILLSRFSIICKTLKLVNYELEIQEGEEAETGEQEEQEGEKEQEKFDDRIKYRIIGILEKEEKEKKQETAAFTISGNLKKESIKQLKSMIKILEQLAVGTLLVNITLGSLKLILEGSQSGLEKIEELFKSGELNKKMAEQNLDMTVADVSFMGTKFLGKPQLAVTIPEDFNQADIDILKDVLKNELIDTSANNIINRIPIIQRLLILLLFFFLGMPLIVEELLPVIFQDTPEIPCEIDNECYRKNDSL